MFNLKGILKQDSIKEFNKKDGSTVQKRIIYIEPIGSVFPVKVSIDDHDLKIGKIGEEISLDLEIYAFHFENGKMMRSNVNYYVQKK